MSRWITCVSVGARPEALTRGKQYEIVALDESKRQVRLRGDNGRTRWFSLGCFDMEGRPAPTLICWWFIDSVEDETCDFVEVGFELSDGSCRWCRVGTPDFLKRQLEARSDPAQWSGAFEPAVWGPDLIVIRRLAQSEVDWVLRHIDQRGELMATSLPCALSGDDKWQDTET